MMPFKLQSIESKIGFYINLVFNHHSIEFRTLHIRNIAYESDIIMDFSTDKHSGREPAKEADLCSCDAQ